MHQDATNPYQNKTVKNSLPWASFICFVRMYTRPLTIVYTEIGRGKWKLRKIYDFYVRNRPYKWEMLKIIVKMVAILLNKCPHPRISNREIVRRLLPVVPFIGQGTRMKQLRDNPHLINLINDCISHK